jgi:hypothetical protein
MPEARLLYTSDLFQPDGQGGWFTPQYLSEFISTCARYRITPNTIFGMHYAPTNYTAVVSWLTTYLSSRAPRARRRVEGQLAASQ